MVPDSIIECCDDATWTSCVRIDVVVVTMVGSEAGEPGVIVGFHDVLF